MLSVVLPRKPNSLPDLAQIFLGTSYGYCLRPVMWRCLSQVQIKPNDDIECCNNKADGKQTLFSRRTNIFFISGAANAAVSQIAPLCHISSSLYPSCNLG
jgi:hypothetical protein